MQVRKGRAHVAEGLGRQVAHLGDRTEEQDHRRHTLCVGKAGGKHLVDVGVGDAQLVLRRIHHVTPEGAGDLLAIDGADAHAGLALGALPRSLARVLLLAASSYPKILGVDTHEHVVELELEELGVERVARLHLFGKEHALRRLDE